MIYAIEHHPSSYSVKHTISYSSCPGGQGQPGIVAARTSDDLDFYIANRTASEQKRQKFVHVERCTRATAEKYFGRRAVHEAAADPVQSAEEADEEADALRRYYDQLDQEYAAQSGRPR